MPNPLISVNLLLYRPGFYLEPCLRSILAQGYDNFELLIIDNNSGDGTAERAQEIINEAQQKSAKSPFYKIIINKKNLGFAGGHNLGIRESKGSLVVMVNQDVILDSDFLKQAAEVFNDTGIDSAQAKILRLKVDNECLIKTDIIDTTGLVILKNRRIIARGQGRQDIGQYDKMEEIFGVDGALPIYRRAALEDTKISVRLRSVQGRASADAQNYSQIKDLDNFGEYFDEDFYMYKEDVDVAWRMRLYGRKAYYSPRVIAWHARTAGESAAINYFGIIRERLKVNAFGKYHSFKNQRLMQIKNEQLRLFFKHLIYWLPKEIASWTYVILFEHYTWRAIKDLFTQAPTAWQKRKIIMAKKTVSDKDAEKWFK